MNIKPLLAVAALAMSGLATAGTTELNSVVVRYGDLNLNSQAGVARLHKRISNAAESVCDQLDTRILGLRAAYEECVADAVASGVAAVDNASLNQFHATKGRHPVLLSSRR
ncbi:MAG TPA: UrcA family protein [Steroidobacteraceae bacterium]|nr:UrcA family protein [Steroidobacteraceae bacterium]